MLTSRRTIALTTALAALAAPTAALADDCAPEGTLHTGRTALTAGGVLGTYSLGTYGDGEIRLASLAASTPSTLFRKPAGGRIGESVPVLVTRPDGTTAAIAARPAAIGERADIVLLAAGVERVLVPGVEIFGAHDLGAAMAPDGSLVLAYPAAGGLVLRRFGPDGALLATASAPRGDAPRVSIAADGTATIVARGAGAATRWTPGAEPVAIPGSAKLSYSDDVRLLDDGHGGVWLPSADPTGRSLAAHLSAEGARFVRGGLAVQALDTDLDGNLVVAHAGRKLRTIAPDGTVVSDRTLAGMPSKAAIEALDVDAAGRVHALVERRVKKVRTALLVREGGRRAAIAVKRRNVMTEAQLRVLPNGTTVAVFQDGRLVHDQTCNLEIWTDVSVRTVRVTPNATRATAKVLAGAPQTYDSGL